MKLKNIFFSLVIGAMIASCQKTPMTSVADYNVIPLPQQIDYQQDSDFKLSKSTKIAIPKGNEKLQKNAQFLAEYIKKNTGISVEIISEGEKNENVIVLKTGLSSENNEAYQIVTKPQLIEIQGVSEKGVFYGIQTLRKSIPVGKVDEVSLKAVTIADAPRFSYRGGHLDVARHFFTPDSVKIFIDILALHNMNTMHWHITDDQGWRFESKKYPKLTEVGSKRKETVIGRNSDTYDGKPHGGFYTQDEIKDIIAYAQDRHITIIPEIDLPGHMLAAISAYPELACNEGPFEVWGRWGVSEDVLNVGKPATYDFIKGILEEVADVFPSEYIHIGGDECPKTQWKTNADCQAKIKELGIKGDDKHSAEEYLQSYVISFAEKVLAAKGKKIIGWDEILEGGIAPNATVMSWRGIEGGIFAAKNGHDAIMTPMSFVYFDYYQTDKIENEPLAIGGYLPVERVYSYEPVPEALTKEEQKRILGVQGNVWTEYIKTFKHAEYMMLPRYAALSEVQWLQPEKKNYNDFIKRLLSLLKIYENEGYHFAKHIFDIKADVAINQAEATIDVNFSTLQPADIFYTTDGSIPTEKSEKFSQTLKFNKDTNLKAIAIGNGTKSSLFDETFKFNKATAKPIEMLTEINAQYKFDGAKVLIDGRFGNENFKTGRWIAFHGNDCEAVIDLQALTEISKVSFTANVITGDWIYDARSFAVEVSEDGKNFKKIASEEYPPLEKAIKELRTHSLSFATEKTRFVKVKITTEKKIPAWHDAAKGKPSFLFIDEIVIE